MTYRLEIIRRAQKELAQISPPQFDRIVETIQSLATNPRPQGCLKLSGRDGWRTRAGDYRVLYDIDDVQLVVTVQHVGHRRDVYR